MFPRPAPAGQGRSVRKAVDVSTHRRAWHKRAGVVVALMIGALLAVPATPAFAAPNVNNVSASPSRVEAGKTTTVSYSLSFEEDAGPADVTVSSNNGKLACVDGCERRRVDSNGQFQATFRLANDASNGTATITVKAVDAQGLVRGEQEASTNVTMVAAPPPTTQAPQTVRSISGKVVDQGGDAVAGAYVLLKDSAGKQRDTTTNGDGNFRFTGSSDNPIAPGRIDIGASAENKNAVASFTANAGQSITGRRITLPIAASESPSASPSASESAVPTEDPFEEELGEEEETAAESAAAQAPASNEDSGGFGNWLLILLGGLFVAVGVGTIVLLWMKRKENEDVEPDGDVPAGAPAGAVPAARGSFAGADDQTRVVNRVGAAPDPTMVGGAGLANAPTMMHQPVVDDVPPDPYGAPPQPYGAASGPGGWSGGGGYGDEPAGYGAPGYGNAPSSGGGYGNAPSSGSGYGNSPSSGSGYGSRDYGAGNAGPDYPPAGGGYGERYDEPTGRYQGEETAYPAPADPYATGMYQPEAGPGYGQSEPGGYGQSEAGGYGRGEAGGDYGRNDPAGGYGQSDPTRGYGPGEPGGYGQSDATRGYGEGEPGGGYGQGDPNRGYPPGQSGGGYGAAPGGGYDQPAGGYGQDAGHQRGGYDNTSYDSGYDQGGYGGPAGGGYGQDAPPRGGYDQGGYGGGPAGGGYGQEPPRQRGGYDNGYDQGGYGQGGGYGDPAQAGRGRPEGAPQDRGGRRLDWLDD
ncbi:carboxypeptidase-like regulatory domain-containing protein [Verrucosispora sp. WMMD703]|uniref:carboxypeptidase-like regulatory domain-containing protein n=1 Tax=unclassified Micromonospora TaxID=2617518 RepID=UPI00249AAB51|nr:carboxypeptidase-like regulatory domain-containing protein [Verrucosispora sp. WMMD1129]WFE45533.1 carboxypeptidase-like regulatory domain-containing protein [Verrucosispora sp. WMMD1129]